MAVGFCSCVEGKSRSAPQAPDLRIRTTRRSSEKGNPRGAANRSDRRSPPGRRADEPRPAADAANPQPRRLTDLARLAATAAAFSMPPTAPQPRAYSSTRPGRCSAWSTKQAPNPRSRQRRDRGEADCLGLRRSVFDRLCQHAALELLRPVDRNVPCRSSRQDNGGCRPRRR